MESNKKLDEPGLYYANRWDKIRGVSTGVNQMTGNDFKTYDDISKNSGYNQSIQDPLARKKDYDENVNSKFREHLNDTYSYNGDYNKHEASWLGGLAATGTRASAGEYSRLQGMKSADSYRNAGVYTKTPGLHTGYGFGMAGSFKAKASEDWKSFKGDTRHVMNEGIRNSLGLLSKQQKDSFNMSGALGKTMIASSTIFSSAMIAGGMLSAEDPGQILTDQIAQGMSFAGSVAGLRLGGAVTGNSGMALKTFGRLTGAGLLGGGAYAAVQGVNAGLRDITSAESALGSLAYKKVQRDTFGDISHNQMTLTARQRALQQISHSTLNDRGFVLGNEAQILKQSG